MQSYRDLIRLARAFDFVVTSTTGGKHNRGSKHALGLAVDVRTRDKEDAEVTAFTAKARMLGVRVIDERKQPSGQKVWSGAHLHLDIGANTMKVVREFQRQNNLTVDGIAGAETIARLKSVRSNEE